MAGDPQRERAAPDEGPASTGEEDRSRLQRVMAHWKVVAGILGIPITVLTLITAWFGVQDRIWPPAPQHTSTSQLSQSHQASPTPQAALEIASFDAQTVLQDTEITYGSSDNPPEDTTQEPTAVVSIGLRNRGDAPVFLTRAVFTFRAYEPLGTCVQVGDAIFTSQVIDVEVPLPPDAAPTETDLPISHGVQPNEVDRLDFRFGTDDYSPFIEPAAISVDIKLYQDDQDEPTLVGTARLLVPAMAARVSLSGLTGNTPAEPTEGCAGANLELLNKVLGTPALSRVDTSPEFEELHTALENYEAGEPFIFPESTK